ncbi:uncharacterized protein BJX67DRAFT_130413 [Aspergillus lucknowensis]|uniref:Uncharacterized protein n=1 Tax=Aspergillus lucknowensis TaxID=176173 RepID=A0ABR4LPV5_9EURO
MEGEIIVEGSTLPVHLGYRRCTGWTTIRGASDKRKMGDITGIARCTESEFSPGLALNPKCWPRIAERGKVASTDIAQTGNIKKWYQTSGGKAPPHCVFRYSNRRAANGQESRYQESQITENWLRKERYNNSWRRRSKPRVIQVCRKGRDSIALIPESEVFGNVSDRGVCT